MSIENDLASLVIFICMMGPTRKGLDCGPVYVARIAPEGDRNSLFKRPSRLLEPEVSLEFRVRLCEQPIAIEGFFHMGGWATKPDW
jgi:hypothetical protein